MLKNQLTFGIVIPLFNEMDSITELNLRLLKVIKQIRSLNSNYIFEICYVDDGSVDDTKLILDKLTKENMLISFITLKKNFGQTYALRIGMEHFDNKDYIITMDGDLQHLPEEMPNFIEKIVNEDLDLVCGWRVNRDENMLRRIPSKIANKLIRNITKLHVNDFGTTYRIIRGEIIRHLQIYSEFHRFLPALVFNIGGSVGEIPIVNVKRKFGKSNYGLSRTIGVTSDLILLYFFFKYRDRPLRFFFKLSTVITFLSSITVCYFFIVGINSNDVVSYISERPGFFIISIAGIVFGAQLVFTGLILEFIIKSSPYSKIYYKITKSKF